jgi:diguanylate cyclase (GGDEF)-like protein/PAS domain S-box-containing protein
MTTELPAAGSAAPTVQAIRPLLDALFANSNDATLVVDSAGTVTYATKGIANTFGYATTSVTGTPVFDFLHPDDVVLAAELFLRRLDFDGPDQGKEVRVRSSNGDWIPVIATAALLADSSLGACVITLHQVDGSDAGRELALRRRIVVGEYANRLGAELMDAGDSVAVLARLGESLGEIGLLTGAQMAAIYLERQEHGFLELLSGWSAPSHADRTIELLHDCHAVELLLSEHIVADRLDTPGNDLLTRLTSKVSAQAMLSTPFSTGSKRGVLVLLRLEDGPGWWDSDSELVRSVGNLCGRALGAAWSEELLALTYQLGPIAFSIRTWDGDLVDCNQQYLDLYMLTRETAHMLNLADLLVPEHRERVFEQMRRLRRGEIHRFDLEADVARGDGETLRLRSHGVRLQVPGSHEQFVLTAIEDISATHEQRLELEFAATHDPLTGTANRSAMLAAIELMQERNGQLPTLLILDVDRFKLVNDELGHMVGDRVLQAIVERISTAVRGSDMIARLGGDEFAVIVPRVGLEGAHALATRLRRSMEHPIEYGAGTVSLSLSIGIALGDECVDLTEVMVRADRALHAAKRKGRNCHVVFDEALQDEGLARLNLERELRYAIDHNQLEVHFQPEFSTIDRGILGAEALIRWRHPERGLIPAGEFIPVAEQSGMIDDIGRFALARGTKSFAEIIEVTGRHDLGLRINISAREFARPELPDLVRSALTESGMCANQLCLELTETTLMDAPEVALTTFSTLRELGVEFAIDDFGTGYSSLVYLKRFPVSTIKIDRTFVSDVGTDSESRAIVESIIGLGQALQLDVVAEGIETEEQLAVIRGLGCERAQGFLIAGALTPGDFAARLRAPSLIG